MPDDITYRYISVEEDLMVAEYPTDEGIVNTLKNKTDSGSDDDDV